MPMSSEMHGAALVEPVDQTDAHHDHCDDDIEHKECEGCCCMHAHTIAFLASAHLDAPLVSKTDGVLITSDVYNSFDPASLYRPPRL